MRAVDLIKVTMGQKIRELRKRADLTQAELGALLDLAASSISHAESGRHGLSVSHLFAIKQHFGAPFESLLKGL